MLFSKNSKLARIHYFFIGSELVSRFGHKNFLNAQSIYFFNAPISYVVYFLRFIKSFGLTL